MNRDQLIRHLRQRARKQGKTLIVDRQHGKGSHWTVYVGDRFTTLADREFRPSLRRQITQTLGLE